MAMLAEGISKTLEQDDVVAAAWRASWTIGLALVIASLDRLIALVVYDYPELLVTELISILFVAEFLDLRLLKDWPERISRWLSGARPWYEPKPKIAVVRNQGSVGVIGRLGAPAPSKYRKHSVQHFVNCLRGQGFEVKVIEGDVDLLRELSAYLPADPRRGTPGGIVFNLATGVQGEGRFSHVPAMLELAGVPYTGPGPLAHAVLADRLALLTMLEQAGLAVPRCRTISDPSDTQDLDFPLWAAPRFEPDARRIVVRGRRTLQAAVRAIRRAYGQPTVVEEIVRGRKIHAALLGNDAMECLPLVESSREPGARLCPAPLDDIDAERIRACARRAFAAAGCRDYARIDLRVTPRGEPLVVDVRWVALFDRRGAFARAALAGGYTYPLLLRRVVDEAARRYLAAAVARAGVPEAPRASTVVPIAGRRAAAE
jgi:D-alanine-D-alanine ligase